VLVDGVLFQLASTSITRAWTSLLSRLARNGNLELFMLDRGNCPSVDGVSLIEFPSYYFTYTASDSILIQEFCDTYDIDVFTSTYYTTALTTPQVQMVYDMTPEVMGFDLTARAWKEKQLALSYAGHFACVSKSTRDDLLMFYPGIHPSRTVVTHCGVDVDIFSPSAAHRSGELRKTLGFQKEFFLFVESGRRYGGHKNLDIFLEAVQEMRSAHFDVLWVGRHPTMELEWSRELPGGIRIERRDLSDAELAAAYATAMALVHPTFDEGSGMAALEAMASGCPVIATRHASLRELVDDAALNVSGHDRRELVDALERVQIPDERQRLIAQGLARAAKFPWDEAVKQFYALLRRAEAERHDETSIEFHRRWKRIRTLQADVDVGVD
jgi:glycosyltransferase involved in cell wall biosynthesis